MVRRLKQPPADLAEFIRLANLVPEGYWLPPELLPKWSQDASIPPGEINIGIAWPELLERIQDQDFPEAVRRELIFVSKIELSPEELTSAPRDVFRLSAVLMHYEKIRIAYYNLRGLTRGTASLDPLENLIHALFKADIGYLRRCAYQKCGKIFYAGRSVQPGCTPEHSTNVRKKNKRERDKQNRHPKKRAKTARKR